MKATQKVKLHNRFDVEVLDTSTGEVKQRACAENIILNQAWAQFLNDDQDWFYKIYYGTGTGTLSSARTALFTPLSSKAVASPLWGGDVSEGWYSLRQNITLLETDHVGAVLTEVGVGTTDTLCTHAMLKDMNGNSVSITKTDLDIITIYATIYLQLPDYSKDAAIDFIRQKPGQNSLACSLLGKRVSAFRYPNYLHFYRSTAPQSYDYIYGYKHGFYPSLLQVAVTPTFDSANKRISYYYRVPAESINVNGLGSFVLLSYFTSDAGYEEYYSSCLCRKFSDANITQSTITEQIGTGNDVLTDFETTFPFVKTGAVIKVDGVVASPTVVLGVPKVKNIMAYMYNLGMTGVGDLDAESEYPVGGNKNDAILENPFYASYGIDSINCSCATIFTSDDMSSWTQVYTTTEAWQTYSVDSGHKQKRYWKFVRSGNYYWRVTEMNCDSLNAFKNVHFAAAPATGAVITAIYDTDVAAKDVNHVLDITIVIQLGEYTP